ncbi:tetraspanin-1 [Astyanax mexicanus]|uniref:Tetraspanin n=1 Tax=Astyanax mexicanus TaxID=7994 RepID=A0A8T2M0T6_ASTMX|nr:tetraspanin-1 [Astyanax mexicanus]KAG9277290.1 tetraspanin-1 [Astyanax mexicanus]
MGCFTFVKVMMVLFNLLILLGGLALAAVGIWLNAEGDSYVHILGIFSLDVVRFVNVGFFFIAIGGVMALLGFLGCWGAKKESKCLLIMFSSIILVIFISEVTTGAVMLTYSSLLESILKEWSTPVLKGQYGKDKVLTNMWNTTMTELHCCGFTNYTDFNDSYYYEENDGLYPPTCCTITEFLCDMNGALNSKIQGCYRQLILGIKKKIYIVTGVAAGVCGVELAAMALSLYLYCSLDKQEG